ncbi:6191_t:CDS:1, partial [Cetraspora pellucida]
MVNNELDDIFEGELSDVDENCRGCKKLDRILRYNRPHKISLPELDFKDINRDTLEATISLLIHYRLYDTLAELISSGIVPIDGLEIPSVVQIKIRKQQNSGKNIHEIFYKELEREIGMQIEKKQGIGWMKLCGDILYFVLGCFKQAF